MSIQDLIQWFDNHQIYVLYYFGFLLLLAIISVLTVKPNNISKVKYLMTIIVYGVTVPGVLALFLSLYNILFLGKNMLKVSLVSYFLPIVAMVVVLSILNKKVKMAKLPGFTKLSSLIIMISIAFLLIFVLQKTYFGVFFLGGFTQLVLVFIVIMVILKIAWSKFSK